MQKHQIVEPGFDVVDQNGDKIGEVEDVATNYFLVTKGLFFPKDFYIPMSAVESVDEGAEVVRINAARDQIDGMGWDAIPQDDDQQLTATETVDTASAARDSFTVPVREEQLRTERRSVEAGEVAVGKHVVEQEQSIDVPLTHEEVDVTRRRVDRPVDTTNEITDDGETIRVPIRAEVLDVRKDARIVEEIEISKRPVTETQRVTETVRREEVDVDAQGDVSVAGARSKSERS